MLNLNPRLLCLLGLATATSLATAQGPPPPGGGAGGPIPALPVPTNNPVTVNKRLLGKALFWDEQLSSTRTMACGTCHIPTAGGSDPRSTGSDATHPGIDGLFGTNDDIQASPGVIQNLASGQYLAHAQFGLDAQVTNRKAPSMIDAAYAPLLFWDGRATSTFLDPQTGAVVLTENAALESQAVGPLLSEVEMGHLNRNWDEVIARLEISEPLAMASNLGPALSNFVVGKSYPDLFQDAFGTADITAARIGMALATYERTLIADQTPIDQGPGALTQLENQGRQIFVTTGRCVACHNGPFLTDFAFKNTGVTPIAEDLGRAAISGLPIDNGAFKTPGLRNVELRAPYFHDGSAATLEEVVDFYDRGGDFHAPNQAPAVAPIGLTAQEKAALVAFLKRPLTDPRVVNSTGPFTRPTLYTESNHQPVAFGFGTPAQGGALPRAIAVEPPQIGNPNLTVAMADGPLFGQVYLAIDFAKGFTHELGVDVLLGLTPNLRVLSLGSVNASSAAGGVKSAVIPVPNQASLVGLPVYLQWFVAGSSVSATEGVEMVLF